MKKPTTIQKELVKLWVSKWKPMLYLNLWCVELKFEKENSPKGSEYLCKAKIDFYYKNVNLLIHPSFFKLSKSVQEESIVHELCHCVGEEVGELFYDLISGKLVTDDQRNNSIEAMTQHFTRIIFNMQGEI